MIAGDDNLSILAERLGMPAGGPGGAGAAPPQRAEFLSVAQAAGILGVSKPTVVKRLPVLRMGRVSRISRRDLDDYIRTHTTGGAHGQRGA